MSALVLQRLLSLSLLATAALVLTLALRPVLRRWAGSSSVYTAWGLLPVAVLASTLPHPAVPVPSLGWAVPKLVALPAGAATAIATPADTARWWLALWALGMLATGLLLAWQQWRFQRELGRLQATGERWIFRAADSRDAGPLLLGLLRPRIVVPADFHARYTPAEQGLILAHERAHLRRGDLWANALASLVQVAFWFNPLMHFAATLFRFDQELACDQAVLRRHPQSRQTYATAMLKTQLLSARLPLGCHWQAQHPLKERIMQLSRAAPARWQRRTATALLSAVALTACYGAWAQAQPTPTGSQASAAAPAAGQGGYLVDFTFTKREGDSDVHTVKLQFSAAAGQHVQVFPGLAAPAHLGCEVGLDLQALPDDLVVFDLPFQCEQGGARHPRLKVRLGEPGTVEVGEESGPGKLLYRYTFVLTIRRVNPA